MTKHNFTIRLTKLQISQVRREQKSTKSTRDIIVAVALENLFTGKNPDERRRFYANSGQVPYKRAA